MNSNIFLMSDAFLNTLVVATLLLLLSVTFIALRMTRKANMMTAMSMLERILGERTSNVQLEVETAKLLDPQSYKIIDLLKAGRLASSYEHQTEILLQDKFCFGKIGEELKKFGDKIHMPRGIVNSKKELLVAVLRVYKGQKFFTMVFRCDYFAVNEEFIPEHLRRYIQTNEKGETGMWVLHQGVVLIGKDGYEVKQDFIDNLITTSALPSSLTRPANSEFRYSRFQYDVDGNYMYTSSIKKDPTEGYMNVFNTRSLNLKYHNVSAVLTQTQAVDIITTAIVADRSTIFLEGQPNSGKSAFQGFLQRELSNRPEVEEVILGNGEDLKTFAGLGGRSLQLRWADSVKNKLHVIFIDDAIHQLEDPELTQSLASLMDGQIKNQANIVLVLSVNRSLDKVPADLIRSGRRSVILNFPSLDAAEAAALVKQISENIEPPKVIKDDQFDGKQLYEIGDVFDRVVNDDLLSAVNKKLEQLGVEVQDTSETAVQVSVPAEEKKPAQTTVQVAKTVKPKISQRKIRKRN